MLSAPSRRPPIRAAFAAVAVGVLAAACTTSAADRVTTTTVPERTAPPSTASPSPTTSSTVAEPSPTPSPLPAPAGGDSWQIGDCFDFGRDDGLDALPYAPYGDDERVPCDGPHTHDVYHVDLVPEGADDPFPEDLGDRVDAACSAAFLATYGLMWPDSTYSLIRYLPDEDEWQAGERYLACVVYRAEDGGLVERRDAPAGGDESLWPADPGACFTGGLRSVRQPEAVDCDSTHTFEVIAVGAHPALAGDAFPSQTQLDGFMDEYCLDELAAVSGDASISVVPIRFGRAEWDLGYRTIRCLAFTAQDGLLGLVRGSFAGDWEIVGVAEDDVVTA